MMSKKMLTAIGLSLGLAVLSQANAAEEELYATPDCLNDCVNNVYATCQKDCNRRDAPALCMPACKDSMDRCFNNCYKKEE